MSEYRTIFNVCPEKYLATADGQGIPDLAICGTAYMTDDETVYAMNGFLDRTIVNLSENPNCVFLARRRENSESGVRKKASSGKPPAYRYHCTFLGFTENESMENAIRSRTAIGAGHHIADALQQLMIFRVDNVREVFFGKPDDVQNIAAAK